MKAMLSKGWKLDMKGSIMAYNEMLLFKICITRHQDRLVSAIIMQLSEVQIASQLSQILKLTPGSKITEATDWTSMPFFSKM